MKDSFSVVMADEIRQPLLRKIASRLQYDIKNEHELRQIVEDDSLHDASVLVAITNEAKPKILLTVRATHIKAHAGEVAFTGGKYEREDDNNVMTALRESFEEVNLNPKDVKVIGQLPSQTSKSGLTVRPIVAMIKPINNERIESMNEMDTLRQSLIPEVNEIARIFWLDLEWLITAPTEPYRLQTEYKSQQVSLLTDCWKVEEETVWGLTGRILVTLLKIGFDRQVAWRYKIID